MVLIAVFLAGLVLITNFSTRIIDNYTINRGVLTSYGKSQVDNNDLRQRNTALRQENAALKKDKATLLKSLNYLRGIK